MIGRLIREPLVHFFLLAALIFAAHGLLAQDRQSADDRISVTRAKIEQLAGIFARTWQRPPSADELKGLIDDYVTEEIYVREAMRLGIDKDDAVIRRRLRLKMEFITAAEAEAVVPTEDQLNDYLEAHADRFRRAREAAFEQVFINPQRRGAAARADADAMLLQLNSATSDAAQMGDATLLPASLSLTGEQDIAAIFGEDFSRAIFELTPGTWQGPVASGFGLHLVRVSERKAGALPPLAEVRQQVSREWTNTRRLEAERQRLEALLEQYKVTIEPLNDKDGGAP